MIRRRVRSRRRLRAGRLCGACRGVQPVDDAAQVAVADGLAVLGERDDRAIDLIEIVVSEPKPSASHRLCTA